eukprot:147002-Chlamydomonas_euryale.AAC.1
MTCGVARRGRGGRAGRCQSAEAPALPIGRLAVGARWQQGCASGGLCENDGKCRQPGPPARTHQQRCVAPSETKGRSGAGTVASSDFDDAGLRWGLVGVSVAPVYALQATKTIPGRGVGSGRLELDS